MPSEAENIHPIHDDIDMLSFDNEGPDHDPIIFGLTSACGGVGVTSIASQIAYRLSQKNADKSVSLLSLDFENSALGYYLDIKPIISVEHFCQPPENIDEATCKSWMKSSAYGFDVLSLPNSADGNHKVNPQTVLAFLDKVSEIYNVLVLDIPRLWTPWTHAALGASDQVGMVSELTVPTLHLTREKSEMLIKALESFNGIDVLLNKYERRSFRNSLKLSDAEKAFGTMPVHSIAACSEKMRDTLNRGEPIGVSHSDVRAARDINDVADVWFEAALRKRELQSRNM